MTQNDLREKVINAEAKVAKRKAVLKKHREQLAKLIQKGTDEFDISIKKDDIETGSSTQSPTTARDGSTSSSSARI